MSKINSGLSRVIGLLCIPLAWAVPVEAQEEIRFAGQSPRLIVERITDQITRVILISDKSIDSTAKLPHSPFLDPEFSSVKRSAAKDVKIQRDEGTVSLPAPRGFSQVLRFHPKLAEIRFDLGSGPVFGLGLGNKHYNRAGRSYHMRPGQHTGEQEISGTRVPISVLYSPAGWGLWFHQPEGTFDLSARQGVFRLKSKKPMPQYIDIFFFAAKKPRDLINAYTRVTGRPAMPPKWALGFMQSHRTLSGAREVYSVARTLRARKLPCDSLIYLGTGYCPSGWNKINGSFEFHPKNFDKPKEIMDTLHSMNFRVFMHVTGPPVEGALRGIHGTLSNTTAGKGKEARGASYVDAKLGRGLRLNGDAQTVRIPHYAALKPAKAITISAWVKPERIATGWLWQEIYRKEDGSARSLLALGQYKKKHCLCFGLGIGGKYVDHGAPLAPSKLRDGKWHLVCGTYDGKAIKFYADGMEIGSTKASGALATAGRAPAFIGSHKGLNEFFKGGIDDVRIYNKALSADEIKAMALADGKADDGGLVGWWKLDGNLSNSASGSPAPPEAKMYDLTHVVHYWEEHRKAFNEIGVDAWWPDDGDRLSREDRLARHRMYHDGYLKERPNQRPVSLNRTGAAGMQRFGGFLGSGDNYSRWETLRVHVPVFLNASVSGLPYVGSCIGGFWPTKELDGELYTRWFQFSAFTPYFRAHGRTWHTRLPWGWNTGKLGPLEDRTSRKGVSAPDIKNLNNPKVEPICRKYLNLRYQLLPYTYTLSRRAYETGEPLMQPMWMHFPEDTKAVLAGDQFFWGRRMLIAPVLEKGAKQRHVYLPKGAWYDFWTEKKLTGGKNHTVEVDLATMPVYIPAGSILPLQAIRQHTGEKVNAPLEIRIYPGEDGQFSLYDDDGFTQKYKTQAGERINFAWQDKSGKLRVTQGSSSKIKKQTVALLIKLVGSDVQRKVTLQGNKLELELE